MVWPLRTLLMCMLRRCLRTLRPAPWNALAPSGSFDVGAAGLPEVEAAGARRVQLARADMMKCAEVSSSWASRSRRSNRRQCSEAQLGDSVGDTSVGRLCIAVAALQ